VTKVLRDEADAVGGTNGVSKVLTLDNTRLSRPTMDNEDATNADVVIAQQNVSGRICSYLQIRTERRGPRVRGGWHSACDKARLQG
jgi:hypothetical protein